MFGRPVMQVALVWIAARLRTIAVASVLASVLMLPACYRMTDELVMPDGGMDAGEAEDTSDAESEPDASSESQAGAGGQAGEAGGAAGTGGIGPFDSGVGPDSGLGDGGPGNSGFPFGR